MIQKLKAFESKITHQIDALVAISPLDEQYFKQLRKIKAITVPVCFDQMEFTALPNQFSLAFLGGMDWLPNRNGVLWFIQEVWALFVKKYPEASFHLAGRNFPLDVSDFKSKGVVIHGEIENASDFIKKQSIMIVPLFSGSGMRVKIIEAMNLARCVVSTPVGAEGIAYENGKNIIIASTKEEWFLALENLYLSKEKMQKIARNSRELVIENYNINTHANVLINFIKSL